MIMNLILREISENRLKQQRHIMTENVGNNDTNRESVVRPMIDHAQLSIDGERSSIIRPMMQENKFEIKLTIV